MAWGLGRVARPGAPGPVGRPDRRAAGAGRPGRGPAGRGTGRVRRGPGRDPRRRDPGPAAGARPAPRGREAVDAARHGAGHRRTPGRSAGTWPAGWPRRARRGWCWPAGQARPRRAARWPRGRAGRTRRRRASRSSPATPRTGTRPRACWPGSPRAARRCARSCTPRASGRPPCCPTPTAAELAAVTAAKAASAAHLDELTADLGLEQFVLFSSIAATWGSGAQAGYAAANAFLDALAESRRGARPAGHVGGVGPVGRRRHDRPRGRGAAAPPRAAADGSRPAGPRAGPGPGRRRDPAHGGGRGLAPVRRAVHAAPAQP